MGSKRIIKQARSLTPRIARATPSKKAGAGRPTPAAANGRSAAKSSPKPAPASPRGVAKPPTAPAPSSRPGKTSPGKTSPASSSSRFGVSAFQSHDEAASAALCQCKTAWITDADAARARARFYQLARRAKRPCLLVSASLSTLLREKARLAELDLPHVLLGGSDTRIARAENDALRRGGALIVLVTSDALGQAEVQGALTRADIAAVAIDGAELASDAGHELRPSYALLPARLAAFSAASRFALARPVTADVRRQAQVRLGLADATVLEGAVVDPAVRLESRAVRGERRNATLIELLPSLPQRGVILCATPHEVDGVCAVLGKESGSVYRVHAAMPHADRRSMSERFDADMGRALLVTTSAFGPDVGIPGLGESATNEPRAGFGADLVPRGLGFVLHHHAPASLEQYVRELACLGPSTPDALSLVFYDSSHRSMNQAILEQLRLPSQKLEAFARVLEATLGGNRPLKAEALALQTGVSRRTSERLLALLLDAGLLRRDAAGIAIENTPAERGPRLEALARALHGLQRDDATRLAAVERYAESSECKRRVLGHYFGRRLESNCGHCSNCRPHADTQRQANAR